MNPANEGKGLDIRDNSIRLRFQYQGKRYSEALKVDGEPMPPTPANIRYATKLIREIQQKIRYGEFRFADYFPDSVHAQVADKYGSLGEFMDHWYDQLKLKASSLRTYRNMKDNFWKPRLGEMKLKSIKHSDITKVLNKAAEELEWKSGKTYNNHLSMISSVFELALADDLIPKNPCDRIKQQDWQKQQVDPFDVEEMEKILEYMNEKYHEQVFNFTEFRFFTGLRTSEAIALEWGDVDFNKKVVQIRKGFVVDRMEEETKTARERTVMLNSRALESLKRQKKWTFFAEHNRVFVDPGTGTPWAYEQNYRKRYWMKTLKALGIRYRRPYNTRHTYATMGLMNGVNPAFMAKQLGHGMDVFLNDYARWISGDQDQRELDKIEALISGGSSKNRSSMK